MFKYKSSKTGRVYAITSTKHLWTVKELDRQRDWPLLPIGLMGRLVECCVERLKPSTERAGRDYLVYRKSNLRLIKPNANLTKLH